jgi:hypothetical protein
MNEKIKRYREKMIRDTIDLNLGNIDVINEINLPTSDRSDKNDLVTYCESRIIEQLLIYISSFDEFNVIQFVSKSEKLYKLYKSLGDKVLCETTKQIHTNHPAPIF